MTLSSCKPEVVNHSPNSNAYNLIPGQNADRNLDLGVRPEPTSKVDRQSEFRMEVGLKWKVLFPGFVL
jgi:hypothetical protein